ncbi:MAG: rhomboid family intramembrane serine protease, partial [Candidatus Helarchaeota archaeon]|nr:rhomboid family intramembrane serine protease [Candidatus Helarchaeota archaeon]
INYYSFLTYVFIHVDFFHLALNMILLIIAGLSMENKIGSWRFLVIFVISALFAVFFDIINRIGFGISPDAPFVGASGAVFGVLLVASLLDPFGKVPLGVIFAALLPYVSLIPSLGVFGEPIFLIVIAVILIVVTTYAIPVSLPLIYSMIIFLVTWVISLLIKYPIDVSSLGHLGGAFGGLISFLLLLPRKEQDL